MIEVTQKAGEKIRDFLNSRQSGSDAIRILLQTSPGLASLTLALDGPGENDAVITEQNISLLIDRDLLEKAKPIRIDFVEYGGQSGFQLTSRLQAGGCS